MPFNVRDQNPKWTERMKSNLSPEMLYADDCNFITELEQKWERIYQKAKTILTNKNVLVNEDKTENTAIKRQVIEKKNGETLLN